MHPISQFKGVSYTILPEHKHPSPQLRQVYLSYFAIVVSRTFLLALVAMKVPDLH